MNVRSAWNFVMTSFSLNGNGSMYDLKRVIRRAKQNAFASKSESNRSKPVFVRHYFCPNTSK